MMENSTLYSLYPTCMRFPYESGGLHTKPRLDLLTAPSKNAIRISNASTLDFRPAFSFMKARFRFSRWAIYSVALASTVAYVLLAWLLLRSQKNKLALLSLWAGVKPSRSSSIASPLEFFFVTTLKLGTLSLSAAILSFKFVRYRFSIMLCAVFFNGLPLLFRVSSSSVSESSM
jgi:hypothetical protein